MGTKERKIREKQRRKNEILLAAHSIFESKGFLNTTLQDVSKSAEVSVGLIYKYFKSKEDIFAALALKGAEAFDDQIDGVLKKATQNRKRYPAPKVLHEIATQFFDFYGPYGEYFDLLIYSYKGLKEVQINNTTLTRLISVTLSSLDKVKEYILESKQLRAKDEEEAMRIVFLLWCTLLGSHKLFDSSGRGHLFVFSQRDFLEHIINLMFSGISLNPADGKPHVQK